MTTINTRITPVGVTADGVNWEDNTPIEVSIFYHEDKEEVVAEWNDQAYTLEEIKGLLTDMEYVHKRTDQ